MGSLRGAYRFVMTGFYTQKGLLQNENFAAVLFFDIFKIFAGINGKQSGFSCISGIAKLTGRVLMVWLWKAFYVQGLCDLFLRIMGFQPSFLLLHPPFFEVKSQRQKQQLDPHILFPGCQESSEPKIVLYQAFKPAQIPKAFAMVMVTWAQRWAAIASKVG